MVITKKKTYGKRRKNPLNASFKLFDFKGKLVILLRLEK
jgi:hypothetical protein